jgi:RNAse (barnase) inhibitor barstar
MKFTHSFEKNLHIEHTFLAFLNGRSCRSHTGFYHTISKAMNFPDYFGDNLDSLDELLCDLSWIDEPNVAIVIFYYEDFLKDDKKLLEAVNNVFANAIANANDIGKEITIYTQL